MSAQGINDLDASVSASLSFADTAIRPFLAYLLQDISELGSSPETMSRFLRKHAFAAGRTNRGDGKKRVSGRSASADEPSRTGSLPSLRVLDLGCGKGSVGIRLAEDLGCSVLGLDGMPEFVECARERAREAGVEGLCRFGVADIRDTVLRERDWDAVVYGAVGDVLGPFADRLEPLAAVLRKGGFLLLDHAYAREGKTYPDCPTREEAHRDFRRAGLVLLEEEPVEGESFAKSNAENTEAIRRRAEELTRLHPDQEEMFAAYVREQEEECESFLRDVICVTWILRKP